MWKEICGNKFYSKPSVYRSTDYLIEGKIIKPLPLSETPKLSPLVYVCVCGGAKLVNTNAAKEGAT